jgi:hypothetical protein
LCQQRDIEHPLAIAFLGGSKQVEEQGCHGMPVQSLRHGPIARAESTRPAAMDEDHKRAGILGDAKRPSQSKRRDPDFATCGFNRSPSRNFMILSHEYCAMG